jgi:hypothetical protein
MTNEAIHAERRLAEPAKTARPGDFDFLTGEWKIKHRQSKDGKWALFDGEATVRAILAGTVSVEELRIASRNFSGMGLRVLDAEQQLWADYWLDSRNGKLNAPSWGSFENGVGTWDALGSEAAGPVVVRGVWDQIGPSSCRWYQTVSRDAGRTWEENWIMHWQRA